MGEGQRSAARARLEIFGPGTVRWGLMSHDGVGRAGVDLGSLCWGLQIDGLFGADFSYDGNQPFEYVGVSRLWHT